MDDGRSTHLQRRVREQSFDRESERFGRCAHHLEDGESHFRRVVVCESLGEIGITRDRVLRDAREGSDRRRAHESVGIVLDHGAYGVSFSVPGEHDDEVTPRARARLTIEPVTKLGCGPSAQSQRETPCRSDAIWRSASLQLLTEPRFVEIRLAHRRRPPLIRLFFAGAAFFGTTSLLRS